MRNYKVTTGVGALNQAVKGDSHGTREGMFIIYLNDAVQAYFNLNHLVSIIITEVAD